MNDKIKVEDKAAVEDATPAPPHPRSESVAPSPRETTGGSPCGDWIDELVDASIKRGPIRTYDKCPYCTDFWHGRPNYGTLCGGSHLPKKLKLRAPKRKTILGWDKLSNE